MAEKKKYNSILISGRKDETLTYTKYIKDEESGESVKESLDKKVNVTDELTTQQIKDGAITNEKMAADSVGNTNLQDGSVSNEKLEDGSITNEKLAENSITKDKLKDNTIGVEKLDPELRQTINAATGLPENLVETIQNVDDTLKDHQSQLDDKQSQIDDKQQQITANDEDISLLQTRSTQMEETIKSIAATGGASQATAVTYNNANSQLKAINIQSAVDELQGSKIDKTSILQESGEAEDKVMSQKATTTAIADEVARANAAEKAIIFDVSANNNDAVFESLEALLSSSNLSTLIPVLYRHGGMTIRFIQGSEQSTANKYVQYRYMSSDITTVDTFTNIANWQGVDDEPTAGSDNLVKSGGVANKLAVLNSTIGENAPLTDVDASIGDENGYEIVRFADGHIKTKHFDSSKSIDEQKLNDELDKVSVVNVDTDKVNDFSISDGRKNILQIAGGHVKTKYFDSSKDIIEMLNTKADLEFVDEKTKYVIARFQGGHIQTKNFNSEDVYRKFNKYDEKMSIVETDDVPSYYHKNGYIENKVRKINSIIRDSGEDSCNFIFITDTHTTTNFGKSPMLIRHILSHTMCKHVVCGGDIVGIKLNYEGDPEPFIMSEYEGQLAIDRIAMRYGTFLNTLGNHDYNTITGTIVHFNKQQTANMFFASVDKNIVKDVYNENGCYYYYDIPKSKIRLFVIDDSSYSVSDAQFSFIHKSIIGSPDNYNFVFVSHIMCINAWSSSGSVTSVYTLIDAINNKTSCIINDVSYNFENAKGNVLAVISGHEHIDGVSFKSYTPQIVTDCDTSYSGEHGQFMDGVMHNLTRTVNTIGEQSFDFINIDNSNHIISCVRIGWGYDRIINSVPVELSVGSSYKVEPRISAVEYKSCNTTGNQYSDTSDWTYKNDVISVDTNGNVSALKIGEAIICAEDANHNKEYFNIIIK